MEAVSWLDRYARMTRRLAEAVIQACERLPTLHVAQLFRLHWGTVRLLERRALQAALSVLPKVRGDQSRVRWLFLCSRPLRSICV